jgi:hypothetical protein
VRVLSHAGLRISRTAIYVLSRPSHNQFLRVALILFRHGVCAVSVRVTFVLSSQDKLGCAVCAFAGIISESHARAAHKEMLLRGAARARAKR